MALEESAEVWVITQNVDGFHVDVGSSTVIELHSNLSDLFCTQCDARLSVRDYAEITIPLGCDQCASLMRPSVVLFGEMLPDAAIIKYDEIFRSRFDLVFAIGTTADFPYIYELVADASRQGVTTVEINPDETPLSGAVTHRFNTGAGTALKEILNAM